MIVDNSIIGAPDKLVPSAGEVKTIAQVRDMVKESLSRMASADLDYRLVDLEVYELMKKLVKGGYLNLNQGEKNV